MDPTRTEGSQSDNTAARHATLPRGTTEPAVTRSRTARAAARQAGGGDATQQGSGSKRSSSSALFAEAAERPLGKKPRATKSHKQDAEKPPVEPKFSSADMRKIRATLRNPESKVFVAGFSSQGGGHTARMLTPLGQAAKSGDTVVLTLPPHWERDTGNERSKLEKFRKEYEEAGIKLVEFQSDKAIWGFYKKEGPSDNFRILEEFAYKPRRDNAQTPMFATKEKGQGFSHHDIMKSIKEAATESRGNWDEVKDRIMVFEDMDPYLGKAAVKAGIPKEQIVGQSNHVTLLDVPNDESESGDFSFQGKSTAFLVKANGNGHDGKMATIDYDSNVNKTAALGKTLVGGLEITEDSQAQNVRKEMIQKLLAFGNRHEFGSDKKVSTEGAVLVAPNANEADIDRVVYMYLNDYTAPLAEHICERLTVENEDVALKDAYDKTVFVVCGAKTLSDETPGSRNAMHIAQAANGDGVTSAGFGTTSEMQHLLENDAYQGRFLVFPVEEQNEQDANANYLLPESLSDANKQRVDSAANTDDLKAKFDTLVRDTATKTEDLTGTMQPLLEATSAPGSISDKAAALLRGGEMSETDATNLQKNNELVADANAKQSRQLNKVMIPLFEAIYQGESNSSIILKAGDEEKTPSVTDLIASMSDLEQFQALTGVEISGNKAKELLTSFGDALNGIMEQPEAERSQAVDDYRRGTYANDRYILGY